MSNNGSDNNRDSSDTSAKRAKEGARLSVARRLPSPAGASPAPAPDAVADVGPHHPTEQSERRGSVGHEISNAIVRLLRYYAGRGPTKVSSIVSGNLVVVTLRDYLTTTERTFADGGDGALAMQIRAALHQRIRPDAIAAVEDITCRRVAAYFTDRQLDPELAIIVFVFETPHHLKVT